MPSCRTTNNPLDPVEFNYDRDVNLEAGSNCEDNYPSCGELINLCLCNVPEITPPPSPDSAKCVNDIATRPWPPPPPANPGCNPVSVNITNRQDTSVTPSENIRLEGNIGYVGEDPCLPEINLELVTNPDFRSGGANPVARGWGVGIHGLRPTNLSRIRIMPKEECEPGKVEFSTPQEFMAEEPGAEHFLPVDNMGCDTSLDACLYRRQWANKVAHWGLVGPRLARVARVITSINQTTIQIQENGQFRDISVPYAWRYELVPVNCVIAGDLCHANTGCEGYPYGPIAGGPNILTNLSPEVWEAYNIKENIDAVQNLSPGVNLRTAVQSGLYPQPIQENTLVMVYGWVPWGGPVDDPNNSPLTKCNCEIVWFFDVPNALAGTCRTDSGTEGLASMIPMRTVTSAGMFFGGADVNRV